MERELAQRTREERDEIVALRRSVDVLAQHGHALTVENEALRTALSEHAQLRILPTPLAGR
ncbi:hypothetical protein [Streptoalloteichus hindustanus]|uniref:hypothetical protein n=1 Tax=Streptoalloteichus hindustanus TaxID=2017 RepID=UPI00093803FD|nr:hypothetical protein [Streptoalloteichus hindustanus]